MAATLTSDTDAASTPGTGVEPLPLVNPITVSMVLALLFLVGVLASVSARPAAAGETNGADEDVPALVTDAPGG